MGTWVALKDDAGNEILFAQLHGCRLRVKQLQVDRWHWSVACEAGRELSSGEAPTLRAAKSAAEDELFAVHPPGGTWFHKLLDD